MVSYGILVSGIMGLHPYFRMKQLWTLGAGGLDARQAKGCPALYTEITCGDTRGPIGQVGR